MDDKRVTLFLGHYGSGKTHAAISWALALREMGWKTTIADLDIVNPYFRTKDSMKVLHENGIPLISSPYAGSNVDLPALPQEMYDIVDDLDTHFVVDVGGDDRGALALGRLSPRLMEENDYEALLVVNFYRPLTTTPQDVCSVLHEIQDAGHLPVTGLVNCSNLGPETTAETILATVPRMDELSLMTGLPVRMTVMFPPLDKQLSGMIPNIFPLRHHQALY